MIPGTQRFASLSLLLISGLLVRTAAADETDPAAARVQLQEGYTLKRQGKCTEALPHFAESLRLDRQPKALLNLADCEEMLGKLVASESHFVEARDLAYSQRLDEFGRLAEKRIARLDKKMPKLVIRLAADAPPQTTVVRDGVELGAISLGTPLPTDPGEHVLLARGAGLEREYHVKVSEGETRNIELTPIGGKPIAPSQLPQAAGAPTEPPATSPTSKDVAPVRENAAPPVAPTTAEAHTGSRTRTWLLWSEGAVATAALAVGIAYTLQGSSEQGHVDDLQAQLDRTHSLNACASPTADIQSTCAELDSAAKTRNRDRDVATAGFVTAAVGVGAVLATVLFWRSEPTAKISAVVPAVSSGEAGLVLLGRFE